MCVRARMCARARVCVGQIPLSSGDSRRSDVLASCQQQLVSSSDPSREEMSDPLEF